MPIAEAMPVLAPLCSVQDGDVLVMSATEPFDYRRVVSDVMVVLSKFSATGERAGRGSGEFAYRSRFRQHDSDYVNTVVRFKRGAAWVVGHLVLS